MRKRFKSKLLNRRLNRNRNKILKNRLKILKLSTLLMYKIGIPINNDKNELLKKSIDIYEDTIEELNKEVELYKSYLYEE